MNKTWFWNVFVITCFVYSSLDLVATQVLLSAERNESTMIWCTVNVEEQRKCEAIAEFLKTNYIFDSFGRRSESFNLQCNQTYNKDFCMLMLDNGEADVTTLDPGEVFVGGRYHSLVPILEEQYNVDGTSNVPRLFAVAVVPRYSQNPIDSLRHIRGKQACFGSVGSLAGWVVPIHRLMKDGGMEIVDCNNHVKSAYNFFGKSCAVNSLSDKYNPLGDNSDQLCDICGSDLPGVKCTSNDPYAGYEGALRCLMEKGDIAFLKHSIIQEFFRDQAAIETFMFHQNANLNTSFPFFTDPQTTSSTPNPFGGPFGQNQNPPFGTQNQNNPFGPQNQFGQQNPNNPFGNNPNLPFGQQNQNPPFGQQNQNPPFGQQNQPFNPQNPNDRDNITNPYRDFGRNIDGRQDFGAGSNRFNTYNDRNFNGNTRTFDNRPENYQKRIPRNLNEFKEMYELLCVDGSRRSVDDWRLCNWDSLPSHAVVTSSAKSPALRIRYQKFIQNLVRQFGGDGSVSQQTATINVYESVPKYGNRSNLMFQDGTVGLRSIPEPDQTYTKHLGDSLESIMAIRSCPIGTVKLCVTSDAELVKCSKMRTALNAQLLKPEMSCHKRHSHINCMQGIRRGDYDVSVFDAGDVYTAGYQFDLIPVLAEIYNLGEPEYYAVAVAYQGDAETELTYLKGKFSCHSGIGHAAGWVVPLAYLISSGRMRNYGCDSVLAASQYFTKSCVPGALSNEYNFGQQYNNLCDLCRGSSFSYCSRDASEDYYGSTGAFKCLIEGGGQVAFVKHTTVSEVTDGKRRETWARNTLSGDYELLCRDGTRAPVTEYRRCNLGKVKANAVVVRGGVGYNDTETEAIINLFLYAQQFYGRKFEDDFNFGMFYSPPPYSDLIFQDAAQQLRVIPREQRDYRRYLGKTFLKARALVDCRAGSSSVQMTLYVLLFSAVIRHFVV